MCHHLSMLMCHVSYVTALELITRNLILTHLITLSLRLCITSLCPNPGLDLCPPLYNVWVVQYCYTLCISQNFWWLTWQVIALMADVSIAWCCRVKGKCNTGDKPWNRVRLQGHMTYWKCHLGLFWYQNSIMKNKKISRRMLNVCLSWC